MVAIRRRALLRGHFARGAQYLEGGGRRPTLQWRLGPQRLTTGADVNAGISLSRDGMKLAFAVRNDRIRLWSFQIDAASGRVVDAGEPITAAAFDALSPVLSRDGTQLIFGVERGGNAGAVAEVDRRRAGNARRAGRPTFSGSVRSGRTTTAASCTCASAVTAADDASESETRHGARIRWPGAGAATRRSNWSGCSTGRRTAPGFWRRPRRARPPRTS